MAWNPDIYNKFKSERFAPFYDLAALIHGKSGLDVIDLGCGTGELSSKLAYLLPESKIFGIDSSAEMLKDSEAFAGDRVRFECIAIEDQLNTKATWDLVFSNAAIQWVDDHETLLTKIISTIKQGGQLAIQLPDQNKNVSNQLLNDLASEEPFNEILKDWKRVSPVLDIDRYAEILFENGAKNMTVFKKVYPLVLENSVALFDWVSGTALIPYVEKLEGETKQQFISQYRTKLQSKFDKSPVFYPFKRILMAATF